jgi:hypothetical protein
MAIEFVECSSLNINYDVLGLATVSFTVVADNNNVNLENYQNMVIGGADYSGWISSVTAKPIIGTNWWEYGVSLVMTSERGA